MSKAFLSHSSANEILVEKIALQLGKHNCHYSKLSFEGGKLTLDEIFKTLEDTDVFVLFISDEALESPWVKKEISQAHIMINDSRIEKIFPIIIDKRIDYKDKRIPKWIRKPYNLKVFDNELIILKKIKQILRESNFKKYSHLREINDLFVGRNDLMEEFERKMINIESTKPSCIIASSFFEGIGRRTFLRNGLIKTRTINKWYEPVMISISAKESIEDFIYKINHAHIDPTIYEKDLSKESMDAKIKLAITQLTKYVESNEIIFVIDDGSIVLPNNKMVGWFEKIIMSDVLKNNVSICLISKFKPYVPYIKDKNTILNFQISELSKGDTQSLFIQYLEIIKKRLPPDDIKYFLNYLKGIPGQIIYAAKLIDSLGVPTAKTFVNDIEEYDEFKALSILEFLKDDELCTQLLITLSKFEFISYDFIYRIFGNDESINKSLQKLIDLSVVYMVSSTNEYIKLSTSVADYVNRSKIELDPKINDKIKSIAKEMLQKPLELTINSDYSEFLFTLGNMITEKKTIPSKYLIPSLTLKSIVKEYNEMHYNTVIMLSQKLLENESNFDYQIIRETRIWLCLAYCRRQKENRNTEKFFETIKYFTSEYEDSKSEYHFLLGFFYRNGDNMELAEYHFNEVLKIDENHSRTKRELVNVYLRKGEYMVALDWAKENYERYRTNILHIQAYFTCLIKKYPKTDSDIQILQELLSNAKHSHDKKAGDVLLVMSAEYEYYINDNAKKAIETLKQSLIMNSIKYFAFRALLEIYKREKLTNEIEILKIKQPGMHEYDE